MPKVVVKCEVCSKEKYVTKRHKTIIGNECDDCLRIAMRKEAEGLFLEDMGYYGE